MLALACIITVIIAPVYLIIRAIVGGGSKQSKPPAAHRQNPVDKHMDDNYADIDWLRNRKL